MTAATIVEKLKQKLMGATTTLVDEITTMRKRITETRQKLDAVTAAPLAREDLTVRIQSYVAETGAAWMARQGNGLVLELATPPTAAQDAGQGIAFAALNLAEQLVTWGALCAANPARAIAHLEALVDRVGYVPGVRMAERPGIMDRLQYELDNLESAEEACIDQANAAGVTIEHRPDVVSRRAASAAIRQREEETIRDRRARQEAIDASRRERPRFSPSQYLQQNRPGSAATPTTPERVD